MTTNLNSGSMPANRSIFVKMLKFSQSENTLFQLTWAILRVGVGLLMIHNGLDKLADVQGFADGVVTFIGLPYPVFLTYCAAYVEIVSALLLAMGFLSRLNAAALLFTMVIAIIFHLKGEGLQVKPLETASLYAISYLFFLVNGGGFFSIDQLFLKKFIKN